MNDEELRGREEDKLVVAKVGDVLLCVKLSGDYKKHFTVGKKYKVLDMFDNNNCLVSHALTFSMEGDMGVEWKPPRRMFRGRNVFRCKHNCYPCLKKCAYWESE